MVITVKRDDAEGDSIRIDFGSHAEFRDAARGGGAGTRAASVRSAYLRWLYSSCLGLRVPIKVATFSPVTRAQMRASTRRKFDAAGLKPDSGKNVIWAVVEHPEVAAGTVVGIAELRLLASDSYAHIVKEIEDERNAQ